MGNGLTTNDGDIIRANQEADMASHRRGTQGQSSMGEGDGGARVPGETPAEVPADNRDPGVEVPTPDGDTMPAPDVPGPDTPGTQPSPTPTPTEVPQVGMGSGGRGPRSPLSSDEIASNERGNGSLGTAMGLEMGGRGTSSTEDAMARAAAAQD